MARRSIHSLHFLTDRQLFSQFQIPLKHLLKNKQAFYIDWRWSDDNINCLAYWKYEEYVKLISEEREKRNEEAKKQQKAQEEANRKSNVKMPNMPNVNNMMNSMRGMKL